MQGGLSRPGELAGCNKCFQLCGEYAISELNKSEARMCSALIHCAPSGAMASGVQRDDQADGIRQCYQVNLDQHMAGLDPQHGMAFLTAMRCSRTP